MSNKVAAKKKPIKQHKVFEINCDETEVSGVIIELNEEEVGNFIGGDMDANRPLKEFNYRIKVKYMTNKQLMNLPEYEG